MEESKMLWAIAVIAMLALAGRLMINRNKQGDVIGWGKLVAVVLAVVAFVAAFMLFNPHRAYQHIKGEATLSDAQTMCIAGRKGGADIRRMAGPSDEIGELYYVLQINGLKHTGYFRNKMPLNAETEVERRVEESQSDKPVIRHTISTFSVTRHPGEKADQYIPLYLVQLENKGSVLVAMEDVDASVGELPVAMLRNTDDKLRQIVLSADSTAISDYYFLAFDEVRYARNQTTYLIYKAVAGLIAAIVVALAYMVFKLRGRK